jgi:hypothetical protein
MFDFLLRKLRPPRIEDPFFGTLVYMKVRPEAKSYWEAKRDFRPTGTSIELTIDAPAPEQPPNERQQRFFADVEARYADLLAVAEAAILPELESFMARPVDRPIHDDLTMTGFSIPDADLPDAEWDMSFDSQSDMSHFITVNFEGMTPTSVAFDG